MALRSVKLHVSGNPAPTGAGIQFRSLSHTSIRTSTSPVAGTSRTRSTIGSSRGLGAYQLPPNIRPFILQGWKFNG